MALKMSNVLAQIGDRNIIGTKGTSDVSSIIRFGVVGEIRRMRSTQKRLHEISPAMDPGDSDAALEHLDADCLIVQ
jgi:hypothetical protein